MTAFSLSVQSSEGGLRTTASSIASAVRNGAGSALSALKNRFSSVKNVEEREMQEIAYPNTAPFALEQGDAQTSMFTRAKAAIKNKVESAKASVKNKVENAKTAMKNKVESAKTAMKNNIEKAKTYAMVPVVLGKLISESAQARIKEQGVGGFLHSLLKEAKEDLAESRLAKVMTWADEKVKSAFARPQKEMDVQREEGSHNGRPSRLQRIVTSLNNRYSHLKNKFFKKDQPVWETEMIQLS